MHNLFMQNESRRFVNIFRKLLYSGCSFWYMIVSFFIIFSKKRTFITKVAGKSQRNRHNASFDFMINQREGGAGISI